MEKGVDAVAGGKAFTMSMAIFHPMPGNFTQSFPAKTAYDIKALLPWILMGSAREQSM